MEFWERRWLELADLVDKAYGNLPEIKGAGGGKNQSPDQVERWIRVSKRLSEHYTFSGDLPQAYIPVGDILQLPSQGAKQATSVCPICGFPQTVIEHNPDISEWEAVMCGLCGVQWQPQTDAREKHPFSSADSSLREAYERCKGVAYKNGALQKERSDGVITAEAIISTPGFYPGGALPEELRHLRPHHVVLGDGPLYVGLAGKSYAEVVVVKDGGLVAVDLVRFVDASYPDATYYHRGTRYIDEEWFRSKKERCNLNLFGHELSLYWSGGFLYACLVEKDGTVWSGFSGAGGGMHRDGDSSNLIREELIMRSVFKDLLANSPRSKKEQSKRPGVTITGSEPQFPPSVHFIPTSKKDKGGV